MKNPPVLVAVLGFFAALAGFGFIFMGFRMIGFDWFGLFGDLPTFDHVGLWGWLAVITGFVWLLAALGLWSLQPWARLFAMIMAGFGLIEATVAFFQFPGTGVGLSMAILPGIVLWYLSTSEVKEAFGLDAVPSEPMAPADDEAAMPLATAAPAEMSAPVASATMAAAPAIVATDTAEPPAPEPAPAGSAAAPAVSAAGPAYPRVPVVDVEGIGPAYAEKLVAVGIINTDDLLDAGASRAGREKIAEASRDQRPPDPRVGKQGRPHARPGCRTAVQRSARDGRRRLARRAGATECREPRPDRPGGGGSPAGNGQAYRERGGDRRLDRCGAVDAQGRGALTRGRGLAEPPRGD